MPEWKRHFSVLLSEYVSWSVLFGFDRISIENWMLFLFSFFFCWVFQQELRLLRYTKPLFGFGKIQRTMVELSHSTPTFQYKIEWRRNSFHDAIFFWKSKSLILKWIFQRKSMNWLDFQYIKRNLNENSEKIKDFEFVVDWKAHVQFILCCIN